MPVDLDVLFSRSSPDKVVALEDAKAGDAEAQYYLALLLAQLSRRRTGSEASELLNECVVWLERAADQGLAGAIHTLGNFHETGIGMKKNDEQARKLFAKAADIGTGIVKLSAEDEVVNFDDIHPTDDLRAQLEGRIASTPPRSFPA